MLGTVRFVVLGRGGKGEGGEGGARGGARGVGGRVLEVAIAVGLGATTHFKEANACWGYLSRLL